jgi:hypothetical protein
LARGGFLESKSWKKRRSGESEKKVRRTSEERESLRRVTREYREYKAVRIIIEDHGDCHGPTRTFFQLFDSGTSQDITVLAGQVRVTGLELLDCGSPWRRRGDHPDQ